MSSADEPDCPAVERATRRLLEDLRPHVVSITDNYVTVTPVGFEILPEYSTSIPTGQADGKVWKCKTKLKGWIMREYIDEGDPKFIRIHDRYLGVQHGTG